MTTIFEELTFNDWCFLASGKMYGVVRFALRCWTSHSWSGYKGDIIKALIVANKINDWRSPDLFSILAILSNDPTVKFTEDQYKKIKNILNILFVFLDKDCFIFAYNYPEKSTIEDAIIRTIECFSLNVKTLPKFQCMKMLNASGTSIVESIFSELVKVGMYCCCVGYHAYSKKNHNPDASKHFVHLEVLKDKTSDEECLARLGIYLDESIEIMESDLVEMPTFDED